MYRYFWISFIFVLPVVSSTVARQNIPDPPSGTVAIEKEKPSLKPTAVRLGANAFRLGRTVFDKDYNSWDITGDIDFRNYFIEVTYGREKNTLSTETFDYENSGSFFRIGPEVNFTKSREEANAFIFGLKYVLGTYDEQFQFDREDEIFGSASFDLNNSALKANWFEINVGVKGKIWQQLYLGFYFRYKFNNSVNGDREFATFQIPGFGPERRRNIVGFDYYVFWRIPFKKSPKILNKR